MEVLDYGKNAIYDYSVNQIQKDKNFALENSMPLQLQADKYSAFNNPKNAANVGCTNSYPLGAMEKNGNSIIDNSYINYMQQQEYNPQGSTSKFLNVNSPMLNGNIPQAPQHVNKNLNNPHKIEGFHNEGTPVNPEIPTNDPTSENLLDMKTRPMTDFIHNNMVPFYGSSVKQNMAGTGVASGNYIDGVNVDSGFDDTTPYQDKLNNFTGLDDTYLHKREGGPQFSPAEQQMGWVNGMPAFRPDEERYKVSIFTRNDMAPCEQEQVGPGLNIDPSIPAQGGYQQYTRVLPNNVGNYKANQLENRVIEQQWQLGGQEPTAYPGVGLGALGDDNGGPGVSKNRPNTFYSQTRYPTMTTKASQSISGDEVRADWNVSKRPNNATREQTNYGFGSIVYKNTV